MAQTQFEFRQFANNSLKLFAQGTFTGDCIEEVFRVCPADGNSPLAARFVRGTQLAPAVTLGPGPIVK
jgi:hypothetical protein